MHGLIARLLNKRGIKALEELDKEEKTTYGEWQRVLDKDELETEDIKKFCEQQIHVIETKWKDYEKENAKKAELIPYHTVYKTLLEAIDSPRSAREALEIYLNQLLKQ